ncbi:MAG: hypothetical protein FWB85_05920 [Chitinispirillia bacterium]|nr:hypothetical protein [Chitinispirillia bacterium]
MLDDKERHRYLIENHRFFFNQFNVWVVFLIAINGGLLLAYASDGLKDLVFEKVLITVLGYLASLVFHCSCKGLRRYASHFIDLLDKHEEKRFHPEDRIYTPTNVRGNIYNPTMPANISPMRVVMLFSFLLTYAWGILFISNFCVDKKSWILWVTVILAITIINITFLLLAARFLPGGPIKDAE